MPVTVQTVTARLNTAADKAEAASDIMRQVANGDASTEVQTEAGVGRMTGRATRHPVVTPQSLPNTGGIFFGNPHRLRPRGGRSSGKGAVAPLD